MTSQKTQKEVGKHNRKSENTTGSQKTQQEVRKHNIQRIKELPATQWFCVVLTGLVTVTILPGNPINMLCDSVSAESET